MPPNPLPPPRYLRFASLTAVLASLVLFGLPFLLHLFTNEGGGFTIEQLNSFALAAAVFWLVLQLGFLAYRTLFRRFKDYQAECLEESGKLFENVTDELRGPLYETTAFDSQMMRLYYLTERRKVAQFTFLVRCVRLFFCLLALAYLLHLAQWAVTVGLGMKPGALL